MARVGRNESCPCGSGKKSKKCCGASTRVNASTNGAALSAAELHELDGAVVRHVFEYARAAFEGWNPFADYPGAQEELSRQLIIPWGAYVYAMDGLSTLEHLLDDEPELLGPLERRWAEAQKRSWLSCWEALTVVPDEGMRMRDLLSGEERYVHERSASRALQPFDVLLGRVVELDGVAVLCGTHPSPLPPREARTVEQTVRVVCALDDGRVAPSTLREAEVPDALIAAWDEAVRALSRRPPMRLQNTDGELLAPTIDRFAVARGARAEVLTRVLALPGAVDEQDGEGRSRGRESRIGFLREGNAVHASWDNTVLGHARLSTTELVVETNSTERADRFRAAVEAACGALVTHRLRERTDVDALMQGATPGRAPKARPSPDPDMLEALRAAKEAHYRAWLDQPIPALDGKTPRAAARSKTLRPELELLVKEVARFEARVPPDERFDVVRLRHDLGLPPR